MILLLGALLLFTALPAYSFDGQSAKAYLDTLCSPEFAGRKSGDPEAHQAELWVVQRFQQFGLQPGAGEGYLQTFPILCNREEKATLELVNGYHGKKSYQNGEDFNLITNSGSGKVRAEVVFVGYGIAAPEKDRDDFSTVDLRGKIALIYKAVPGSERDWEKEITRDYKVNAAVARSAKAVLFVHDQFAISGAAIHQEAFHPDVPVLMVSENVVEDLFRGTGKRWETVKSSLEKGPQSFPTGKVVQIHTKLNYNPQAQAANVIGVIPGTDPQLKNEWVVLGGHLDHNGVNAEGDIFYGADDNASGASIVIELARQFAAREVKPKRSLMFIAFAAEEQGLLGSEYFVNHPTVPLERVATMINFDCCGLGKGGVGFGGAEHFPEIWETYKATLTKEELDNLSLSTIWRNGSDNHSFQMKDVPTFNYWSSGARSFYHLQDDLPSTISLTALTNVGQAAENFISYLADWEKPLLQDHYRARTWVYSAYTISLRPLTLPLDSLSIINRLNEAFQAGLKCSLVSLPPTDPYSALDYWRRFCQTNDFILAKGSKEVKDAVRKHQLALLPVINNPAFDFTEAQIRNLADLGVKVAYLSSDHLDSSKIALCQELGMTFILRDSARNQLPKAAKAILLNPHGIEGQELKREDLKTLRFAIVPAASDLTPDSLSLRARVIHLNLDLGKTFGLIQDFWSRLEELEKAGFTGQQIVYMLGENLLEILPEE